MEALDGAPVVTGEGFKVTDITLRTRDYTPYVLLVHVILADGAEIVRHYTQDGHFLTGAPDRRDLFMLDND